MAFEGIGLQALLKDEAFQAGLKRYQDGVSQMESATDKGASAMTRVWSAAAGAVTIGAAAVVAGAASIVALSKQGLDAITNWGNQLDQIGDVLGTTGEQSSVWAIAMKRVGLSVEEGAPALNFFVKNLDNLKDAQVGAASGTAKSAEQIDKLKDRLDDANVRLDRAKKKLAEAEKPTDAMRNAVDDAQKAVNRLNDELNDAQKIVPKAAKEATPFGKALETLGVKARDSKGNLRTFDDLMPEIMRSFQKMPDGVQKSALAIDLFGKSGTKFLDFLSQGDEGLAKAIQLGELYGLTMSTDMVQATQEFQYGLETMQMGLQGVWLQIGQQVLPVLTEFIDFINFNLLPPLVQFAKQIAPAIAGGLQIMIDWFEKGFLLFKNEGVPIITSLWNILQLLVTGDFSGGIFGLQEDDPFIAALFTIRDTLERLRAIILTGDWASLAKLIGRGLSAGAHFIGEAAAEYGTQFWNWLTGPNGAIMQAGQKVAKLTQEIASLLVPLWQSYIQPALAEWVPKAWEWLTSTTWGVIVQATEQLSKWAVQMEAWSRSPAAVKSMQDLGHNLAQVVIDAMKGLFGDKKTGDDIIETLLRNLWNSATNMMTTFHNVGMNVAEGFIDGILDKINLPDSVERVIKALYLDFIDVVDTLLTQGPLGVLWKFVQLGADTIGGIVKGIEDNAQKVIDALIKIVNDAVQGIEDLLWIGSPSKVFAGIGANMAQGLMEGFAKPQLNFAPQVLEKVMPLLGAGGAQTMPALSRPPASAGSAMGGPFYLSVYFNGTGAPATRADADLKAGWMVDALRARGVAL